MNVLNLFFGVVTLGLSASVLSTDYYVSTTGNDSNSGSSTQPFLTLEKARDAVRLVNSNMTGDITVYIADGDYYVDQTIAFTEADSGTNGYEVVYINQGEIGGARFLGGEEIVPTFWTQYSGNIYKTNVGTNWQFNTLYENGKRARKARYPNFAPDPSYPTSQAGYLKSDSTGVRSKLKYKLGELSPTGWI